MLSFALLLVCIYLCLNEKVREKEKGRGGGEDGGTKTGGRAERKRNSHTWERTCTPIFDHMKDSAGHHAEALLSIDIYIYDKIN